MLRIAHDNVVVTGDITNLALESEYHEARALLDDVARSVEVMVIPHEYYTGSSPWRRFGAFVPRRRSSFNTVGGILRHPQAFA